MTTTGAGQAAEPAGQKAMDAMSDLPAAQPPGPDQVARTDGDGLRAELPADLTSARQARSAVRQPLAAWRMDHLSGDAELLASELVANAAEHGDGTPISLALRRYAEPDGRPGITCEVTDASPTMAPARGTRRGRRARPGPGDRRRAGPIQRRTRHPGRQDHLVHPRPHRPRPPGRRSDRARARSRGVSGPL